MKKVEVLLGDFTFIDASETKDGTPIAYINRIDHKEFVDESELDEYCENALENYECYLIPSEYVGEIIYRNY